MDVTLPLASVETTMLVSVRIVAFLVLAPPFSHRSVPAGVKVALSLGLALAVAPRMTLPSGVELTTGMFIGELAVQALIGAALGFLVYLVFAALQSAGNLIDLFGGFQIAQAFDPLSQTSSAQFGRLYQFLAVVLRVASDAYQVVLTGLVRTFDLLPLGRSLEMSTYSHLATTGLTQMFVAAVQIAGPLIVMLFLADVGLGLLTRVAPALNAFAMGFPLKILLTLSFGSLAMLALPQVLKTLTGTSVTA